MLIRHNYFHDRQKDRLTAIYWVKEDQSETGFNSARETTQWLPILIAHAWGWSLNPRTDIKTWRVPLHFCIPVLSGAETKCGWESRLSRAYRLPAWPNIISCKFRERHCLKETKDTGREQFPASSSGLYKCVCTSTYYTTHLMTHIHACHTHAQKTIDFNQSLSRANKPILCNVCLFSTVNFIMTGIISFLSSTEWWNGEPNNSKVWNPKH